MLAVYAGRFRLVRAPRENAAFHLRFDGERLLLCRAGETGGVCVDPAEVHRRLRGAFLLGRACGVRRDIRQRVLDATAGLGIDGLALALTGHDVHLVEREPALWALLHDLLRRLDTQGPGTRLTCADSTRLLHSPEVYDVICFDPMFDPRRKTALSGKRMQYLSQLLGEAPALDVETLLLARERARGRVVLKRRAKEKALMEPDWSIRGRSIRYDVYRGTAV